MRSKEIFTEFQRSLYKSHLQNEETSDLEDDLYNALMLAEAEIEELREKLHLANVEISSFTDLRPEN
jgi:hypothetical protein